MKNNFFSKFGKAIKNEVSSFFDALIHGDVCTKLSFIVMGAGNFLRGQLLRGFAFLALEAVFFWYLITNGLYWIHMLKTLGEVGPSMEYDSFYDTYVYTYNDNSFKILLYGILTILFIILFVIAWRMNIKEAFAAQKLKEAGKPLPKAKDDFKSLIDEKFYKTLLALPVTGIIIFTALPILFMILVAFTNYDGTHDGNVFLEAPGRVSVSPNGNGGWFVSMMNAGVYDKVKELGIEWFNLYGVDNVCQRICDPVFIGAVIDRKCAVGSKVVRKNDPDEKMGVMCLEDGHPSIIEYTEMTPELRNTVDSRGERVYNFGVILNYLFRVADLEEIVKHSMPYHIVEKKINHLGPDGEPVKPETPCGYKFEQFVLDMIRLADDCLPFEVVRDYEFAPVKNRTGVDSVESARELLKKNGVTL